MLPINNCKPYSNEIFFHVPNVTRQQLVADVKANHINFVQNEQ